MSEMEPTRESVKEQWEQKQEYATKKVQEMLGDQRTEDQIALRETVRAEMIELHEMQSWFTDLWDEIAVQIGERYTTDTMLQAAIRTMIRKEDPNKFARLRELEMLNDVRNAEERQIAGAAHASVIEANIRSTILWKT